MLFREFYPHYLETIGPRSYDWMEKVIRNYLLPEFGEKNIAAITYQEVYEMHRRRKKTPVLANRVLAVLSCIIKQSERLQIRPGGQNPCPMVRRYTEHNRRRYMSPEEIVLVSAALKAYESINPQAVLNIYGILYTGARPSELVAAKWEDLKGDVVVLKVHKTDRGGYDRRIFMPPIVMDMLNKLPRPPDIGVSPESRIFKQKRTAAAWRTICKNAGVKNLRMYDLRHHFASTALSAGFSLAQIGELLGHRDATTTMRYAHMVDGDAKDATKATAQAIAAAMRGG